MNDNTIEEQYDKIYRYCYFKVHHRETAEDITQETFLRFWESRHYKDIGKELPYLYTIARNLCIDEFKRQPVYSLEQAENAIDSPKENLLTNKLAVQLALSELTAEDRELLLLRYANEVPLSVICKLLDISRFAVYRKCKQAVRHLEEKLGKEDFYE